MLLLSNGVELPRINQTDSRPNKQQRKRHVRNLRTTARRKLTKFGQYGQFQHVRWWIWDFITSYASFDTFCDKYMNKDFKVRSEDELCTFSIAMNFLGGLWSTHKRLKCKEWPIADRANAHLIGYLFFLRSRGDHRSSFVKKIARWSQSWNFKKNKTESKFILRQWNNEFWVFKAGFSACHYSVPKGWQNLKVNEKLTKKSFHAVLRSFKINFDLLITS